MHPTLILVSCSIVPSCFFSNSPATSEIYTLSLHDALPISRGRGTWQTGWPCDRGPRVHGPGGDGLRSHPRDHLWTFCEWGDRKSTRLNSSHQIISYAVFCLKKKKQTKIIYSQAVYKMTLKI